MLRFRNKKIAGVEIDLVVQFHEELWLIEVKSALNLEYLERRVTPGQMKRIRMVLKQLLEQGQKARAHLILVTPESEIFVEDFFVRDL